MEEGTWKKGEARMNGELIIALIALAGSVGTAVLAYVTNSRAGKTADKRAGYEEEDLVAKRRLGELNRVYERLDKLEHEVEKLQSANEKKDRYISEQANRINALEGSHLKLLGHVGVLEQLVPNPPGPPPRPVF